MLIVCHRPNFQRDVSVDRACDGRFQREEFLEHRLQIALHLVGIWQTKEGSAQIRLDDLIDMAEVVLFCTCCSDPLTDDFEVISPSC